MNNNLVSAFHRNLQRWYAKNGRKSLPWRNTRDPYKIYISEIMLQQTQVKTVLERYYEPFLTQFPTLSALAKAPRKEVLKAWEGLGYYNRAINLHEASKSCNGKLPKTVEALLALPGIGKNTAHAVAAFAYHQPVPVVEANVKRVMARIFALKETKNEVMWQLADTLLDRKNPFDYNQAMMDLGAMVCTKRAPKCMICPANTLCKGKKSPESYPAPKTKRPIPVRKKNIVVLCAGNRYFAKPREGRFLQGLYQFSESKQPRGQLLGHIRQQYSHFTLEAKITLVSVTENNSKHWYTLAELKQLPFSAAEQKILDFLSDKKRLASAEKVLL
jgi:A/G-specific adenine glycosylase